MSERMVSLFLSAVMFVVYSFGATATPTQPKILKLP